MRDFLSILCSADEWLIEVEERMAICLHCPKFGRTPINMKKTSSAYSVKVCKMEFYLLLYLNMLSAVGRIATQGGQF